MQDRFPELIRSCSTVDKAHGRLEEREIFVIDTSSSEFKFKGLKQIAKLRRKRTVLKSGKTMEEEIFIITNLEVEEADAEKLLFLKRDYWSIENKLHYRKDFVFGEDRSTIRAEHGPENMASLRNFAISLLMANDIDNVKRCVDNIKYQKPEQLHTELFHSAKSKAVTKLYN